VYRGLACLAVFLGLAIAAPGTGSVADDTALAEDTVNWSNPVISWVYEDYSTGNLKRVYRALHKMGFFVSNAETADLTRPDLVSYIERYQAHIGAEPTGYLSRRQLEDLLAGQGTLALRETRQAGRSQLLAGKAPDEHARLRANWQKLGYSQDQKKKIYRALYHLRLAGSAEMMTDFSFRLNLIEIVRGYQKRIRFNPTGFLTREQAEKLLAINAPLLPSERQAKLFAKYGSSPVLRYFRDLGEQEYGISTPVSAVVKRFQGRLGLTEHGYVTPDLLEAVKSVQLQVVRTRRFPKTIFYDVEELVVSRDWSLWQERDNSMCEITTSSIHEDGFFGSASPSSVSLYRDSDWEYNAVNTSILLENWKPDSIAELRVGGRSYYTKSPMGRTRFVAKDGSRPKSPRKNYANLINDMLRANGFEIIYETVFGTRVVASFSAMGLTKQLRAMMKAC
jgi:hypothetical protein